MKVIVMSFPTVWPEDFEVIMGESSCPILASTSCVKQLDVFYYLQFFLQVFLPFVFVFLYTVLTCPETQVSISLS